VFLDEDTPASSVARKAAAASARAIRRRNFIDICREAVSKGII
jgi:hypothetical protein